MKLKAEEEEKFNKGEETDRQLSIFWKWILTILSISLVVFHIYTAFQGNSIKQTSYHFLFALTIAFIIYPVTKKQKKGKIGLSIIDIVLVILAVAINVYYIMHFERIFYELGFLNPTQSDVIFASITLLVILEGARRAIGIVFPVLALIALIYAIFGPFFPGFAQHQGFSWSQTAINMYMGQSGIFQGELLGVSASVVAIFIIFGALLLVTGGGSMFIKLSIAIAGRLTGGPAKVSTIASGLFGSVSGSTAANAATTGVFTIPLMKNNGYKNHFAGGVEAAASCGGQILPPVMGAAAFVLAEVTQISYTVVAASAIIPALLFYLGVWMSVHFEAKRIDLKPVKQEDMIRVKDVVFTFEFLTLFIPLLTLVIFLVMGYTPVISAFWAIVSSLVLFIVQNLRKKTYTEGLKKLIEASIEGAKTVTMIAVIVAVAQIIATVIGMTGLGGKLSSLIVTLGETNLILTLILGMVVTILFGMGVPTIAAYMLSASVIASAFATLGLPILATHMFILYFAILSGITPPVSLAAYIASGIANAHWLRTALTACKIGLSGFLIPFMFIYHPALLGQGTIFEITIAVITAIVGIIALAGSTIGYFLTNISFILRSLLLISALLLVSPGVWSNLSGFLLITLILIYQIRVRPSKKVETSLVDIN